MKTIKNSILTIILLTATLSFAQKEMKNGTITFNMSSDSPQMAMMGDVKMVFSFNDMKQAMNMEMMGGMMEMKVITNLENTDDVVFLMNTMGQKYNITDANKSENGMSKSMDMSNLDKAITVTYDKKATKKILGYECYKATVTYEENKTGTFYITDKITPKANPKSKAKISLAGYPLEMEIEDADTTKLTIVATDISSTIAADSFTVPADYEKMTMEELQKKSRG